VAVGRTFRLEHMNMMGWQLFVEVQIVKRGGDAQHLRIAPDADGMRGALVSIYGEAA
jgi:hypothetical protein